MTNAITLTNDDHQLTPLGAAGQAANTAAARHLFDDYASRRAPNTIRRQRADLRLFVEYLSAVEVLAEPDALMTDPAAWQGITWGIVAGFVRWSLAQGYAVASVNVRLSTIKVYAKLAAQAGAIPAADYALIRTVTGYTHKESHHVDEERTAADLLTRRGAKKDHPVVLTAAQVKALKDQPDTPQGRRDALILCLAFDMGLRVGEIAALDVTAINLSKKTMMFYRAKVSKEQTHILKGDVLRAARAYLLNDAPPVGSLLRASVKGGRLSDAGMTERAITKRIGVLAAAIGIEGISAHDGRHTWATRAAAGKTDPFALQEAGGWNSLAMPRRYVEASKIANEGIKFDDD